MYMKKLLPFLILVIAYTTKAQVTLPDTVAYTLPKTQYCVPAVVTPSNVLQTLNGYYAMHNWSFGNGTTSTVTIPGSLTYTSTGVYTIIDSAKIVDATVNTYIKKITVLASSCSDAFGNNPDFFAVLSNSASTVYTFPTVNDTDPPVAFTFTQSVKGLLLNAATQYSVTINDEDVNFNDNCGTVAFNSNTSNTTFTLTNGGLSVKIELTKEFVVNSVLDTVITANQFTVSPLPIITASTNITQICAGESATLSVTGTDSYLWLPGNFTQSSITVMPNVTTTYTVIGTSNVGCSNSTTIIQQVSACTSIFEQNNVSSNQVVIYPTPTEDVAYVEIKNYNNQLVKLEITDALGKIVLSSDTKEAITKINTVDFTKGIYFLTIKGDGYKHTKRFIKN